VDALLDTVVGRVMDHLGVEAPFAKRWGGES
jgi:3-polyprenyl-4-hydroxybenzoate decarboxylase